MPDFSNFDSRGYPTVDARAGYAEWAPTYEDAVKDSMDIALLARLEIKWAAIESAVDLGCGTGRIGEWLSKPGSPRSTASTSRPRCSSG